MSVRTEQELELLQRIEIKYCKIQKTSIAILFHNNKHELLLIYYPFTSISAEKVNSLWRNTKTHFSEPFLWAQ